MSGWLFIIFLLLLGGLISTLGDLLGCLLYTSDAADDSLRVDLGGRRIIKNNDEALIKLPVKIVIKIAVFFGLNFKILNLALPIFEPNKSPNVEIKPPSSNKKIMKSQPDTIYPVSYTHLTLPTTPYV